jgi:hypothetical protein
MRIINKLHALLWLSIMSILYIPSKGEKQEDIKVLRDTVKKLL